MLCYCENMENQYGEFLERKGQMGGDYGFEADDLPEFLFPFQRELTEWALRKGRGAIFADCGLGKGPMALSWAQAVAAREDKPVLILTPLAVSYQLVREAEKFGIEAVRLRSGDDDAKGVCIVVTNYERLSSFSPSDFCGVVCDESSILKNFSGVRKSEITEFMKKLPYRLLCTATAAPNDYIELGTSSEALGELGYMDMLGRFFVNDMNNSTGQGRAYGNRMNWRFKGHAETHFWKWVASWARACRKPSDIGYEDGGFDLPPLTEVEHLVKARTTRPGYLFELPAQNFREEREERRRTIQERCEKLAELATHDDQVLVWCHMNDESKLLSELIPGAAEVKGGDDDDEKEAKLIDFADGNLRALVTKPKIGAWGLNFQKCAHIALFPSHSYEQYYQGIRRCWRFGQERPVKVDIVASEGESGIKANLQRKADQADRMFTSLTANMGSAVRIETGRNFETETEVPQWL